MDAEQKKRLKQLKEKNNMYIKKRSLEDNTLLNECITVLKGYAEVLEQEDKNKVFRIFDRKIPFLPWGIDWKKIEESKVINCVKEISEVCISREFYIIWHKEFPIIKCDLCAVEWDTWLLSIDYKEVVEFTHDNKITFGKLN